MKIISRWCLALCLISTGSWAACYDLSQGALVGEMHYAHIKKGDTFVSLAQRYGVGYNQIQAANPNLDADKPLVNAVAVMPARVIVPPVPHKGIVINLSQMRLFYFPPNTHRVCVFPVGIGQVNWSTPQGQLHIMQKIKNPVWIVPDSVMAYRKKHGDPLSKIMQSGPDNPLGYFALRLSKPTYLIHGTNDPGSIGRRSSAGCIHLFADDIKALFAMVSVKTPVRIIDQPYLFARHNGQIWFSAFPLLKEFKTQWSKKERRGILKDDMIQIVGKDGKDSKSGKHLLAMAQALASHPTGVAVPLVSSVAP